MFPLRIHIPMLIVCLAVIMLTHPTDIILWILWGVYALAITGWHEY